MTMISVADVERAGRCTEGVLISCAEHPTAQGIHSRWSHIWVDDVLTDAAPLWEALERHVPESWDDDAGDVYERWIEHMATTHGAACPGRHCEATAERSAAEGALRQAWRDSDGLARPSTAAYYRGYRDAIRDLAHALGIDLDQAPTP